MYPIFFKYKNKFIAQDQWINNQMNYIATRSKKKVDANGGQGFEPRTSWIK